MTVSTEKHGCAMGSPVSPIVANFYMEEVESKAMSSYKGTVPSHWFRYVDDTWVKIKTQVEWRLSQSTST